MLTIEEIKRAVGYAVGFSVKNDGDSIFEDWGLYFLGEYCQIVSLKIWIYDLFLDRVIQGFCKKYYGRIFQDWNSCSLLFNGKQIIIDHNGTTEEIREAREKAIRFVLKEANKNE